MIDENTQEEPSNVIDFTKILMPFIEEDVPLPRNAKEALPSMTSEDEVLLRAQTIKELSDITGEEIAPDAKNIKDAEDLARKMIEDPSLKQEYANYPNETIAYLAGLVGAHNHMIVKDLAELKLYVVNKLVHIVEHSDNPKEQIAALRSIGEVDGVDAFKKKTEITHVTKTIEEVEESLLKTLESLESKIIDVDYEEIIDDRAEEKESH
jgi:hypothetical protein